MKLKGNELDRFDRCPFCNSDAVDVWYYDAADGLHMADWRYQVKCNDCGAMLERRSLDEAESAWNRREYIPLPPVQETPEAEDMPGLNRHQKTIIVHMAQKSLKVSEVARSLEISRSKVDTALFQIRRETGLDPWNFFDLQELYQMATSEVSK